MKKLVSLLVLLAVVAAAVVYFLSKPATDSFVLEEGYTSLYNGETLDGWRVIGGKATFAAQGEDIVGRRGPGGNTFLRTEKTYGDFSLKMQMRWDELGNSGVLFRSHQRERREDAKGEGESNGRAYGYQFELDHSPRSWSGGVYDEARRGWLANLENNPQASSAIRLDDWNDIEIEARGATIKTWINGVPAADIIDGLDAQGFIALQVHQGKTGTIRWRHIRLRELPPMAQAGESLMKQVEWSRDGRENLRFEDASIAGEVSDQDYWISPRRQFSDALVRMTVSSCDEATTVQMRYVPAQSSEGAMFAEVKIFSDRAEARLVTAAGEQKLEVIKLKKAQAHKFTGTAVGDSIVLSVDEKDAVRFSGAGLPERGQLRIQPARCDGPFEISGLEWFVLKEGGGEPLFYQTLDNEPAPVLSPEQALAAFKIAPGFEIELVAAEPLVEDPVAMSWDEYGRLYVVELRGYMRDAYGTGSEEPVGQVVRLEDTDGDGRMDTSEVFLGGLVNPRAVAVVNEGILIAEPPNLWLCTPSTPTAGCDNKRRIGSYAADVGSANVEHMENGLLQGLDNWLYNSKSDRKLRMQDDELVEEPTLFRGQWGITKDNYGRLLYNHNSTWIQADLFVADDLLVPGENARPKGLGVNLTSPAEVFTVRVNPGVNRAYLKNTLRSDGRLKLATGVSGLVAYRGDQFPNEYRNDVFVPEAAGNVVGQFALTQEGIELKATQRLYDDSLWGKREFLGSTDERFRPVDAMNGPDGALYVIDMYRGIVQDDHFLTDELREQVFQRKLESPIGMGRIWRVRHSAGTTQTSPHNLVNATSKNLVDALAHPNGWVRDTAQRLLLDGEMGGTGALKKMAQGDRTIAALHAIWVLAGRGELERDLVMAVAASNDEHRQIQILRAGRAQLSASDLQVLQQQLQGAPEAVRVQLAFAMGAYTEEASVQEALVAMLLGDPKSIYLRQAIVRAARGQEFAVLEKLLTAAPTGPSNGFSKALLKSLSQQAYLSLRGDLTSADIANPVLLDLLELVESRRAEMAWQQLAMLSGFAPLARKEGFVPAVFDAAPPIFADGAISQSDPLWAARLAARIAFTWPGDELALGIKPLSPEQLKLMALGETFYPQCAACHGAMGEGISGLAPALAGASWVAGPPEWLGRIILQGLSGPIEVNGEAFDGVMPPHGHLEALDDDTLAGLMTYLRRSWVNKSDPVSAQLAADIRAASADHTAPWTAVELQAVVFDRGYHRFVGEYAISFVTFTVSEETGGLHMSVPMYGSGVLNEVSDTVFTGEAGGEKVKVEFVVAEDGSVNQMLLHRDGEKIPIDRVVD
jgi:mono/diheme cytochrome c family protein